MILDIQFKLKNNQNYLKYIRENSHWYKLLTRNPNLFKTFEEEVKENYKLRPIDRISKVANTFELLNVLMSSLK